MWKETLLVGFASVLLHRAEAQGGAESLSFHGFLPFNTIRSNQPRGDNQPNDVYSHLERKPILRDDQDVYYPPILTGFGLEYGQDPEERVYQVFTKQEVDDLKRRQMNKKSKHGKSVLSKGAHSHDHDHDYPSHSEPVPPPPSPIEEQPLSQSFPPPPPPHHHHYEEPHFP